jgi:hypothetical protein
MKIKEKLLAHSMRALRGAFALWLVATGMAFSSSVCAAQAPLPDAPAIEAQARAMVAKLTLEQKIELLGGVDDMFTHADPAINLPRLKMSDASVGVRHLGTNHSVCRRHCAGCHMGPRFRAQARRKPWQGCARPRGQLPPRSRREHRPLSGKRPQL